MTNVWIYMEWADQHGLWDCISTTLQILAIVAGVIFLAWAKRRVRNLNFFFRPLRRQGNYPFVIVIEIRNYTGRTVVISNPYFNYDSLRPDANARGDSASGDYEIKFPRHLGANGLDQVEFMLRHGETVSTWIPLDPQHSDQEVENAMQSQTVGKIKCMCTWLLEKPKSHKLVRKIGRPTNESSVQ